MGNNGFLTYADLLVVENYSNGSMSIREFYEIAKNYIDTVKADRPVSLVQFLGKNSKWQLPDSDPYYSEDQKKYYLLSIGFNNDTETNRVKNLDVDFIALWLSEEPTIFFKTKKRPNVFDSLLSIKQPYNNHLPHYH